jgi:CubicO group peptidase (beta-lactamase class C family)
MKISQVLAGIGFAVGAIASIQARSATLVQDIPPIAAETGYVKCYSTCQVGTLTTPAVGLGADYWRNSAILSFDTATIPTDAIITKVYVTIGLYSYSGDPWMNGNVLYVDVNKGAIGANAVELTDANAAVTASAVTTVPRSFTNPINSSIFSSAGISAINKQGRTQIRLRFAAAQSSPAYLLLGQGTSSARLHVEYQMPTATAVPRDYWPTTAWRYKTMAEVGINATRIGNLISSIQSGTYGKINSLLIVKNGYIVSENYFNGGSAMQVHELQSATKSIGSTMLGIAMDKGYLTVDDKIVDIFGPYYTSIGNPIANSSAWKSAMTVKNVLTQKHGSQWNEWCTGCNQDNVLMTYAADWNKYVLDKPMAAAPGTVFNYSTGHSGLMGGMIKRKTPYKPEDFSKTFLFDPIGIKAQQWLYTDSTSMISTGAGLGLTAQDMARFGFLILNRGKWNGQQIVSQAYLDAAYNVDSFNVLPINHAGHYGYQMWLIPATIGSRTYLMRTAAGMGGQYIYVVPELDLVVATTAANYDTASGQYSSYQYSSIDMMENQILPAVLGQ